VTEKNIYIIKIIVTILLAVVAATFAAGTINGNLSSRVDIIERDHLDHSPMVLDNKIDYLIEKCSKMHDELKILNNKIITVENDMKWLKKKNGYNGRETVLK